MHSATEKIYRRYNSNVPFASVKTFARKDRYAKLDNDSTLRKSVRRFSRASREQDQVRNRSHYLMTQLLLLPIILAAWSTSIILGQESTKTESHSSKTRKANGYAFVSPNTRENLTIREAITGLSSLDEQRLIDEAVLVTCRLHLVSRLERAVGSWSDGAQHSTVLRTRADETTLRYAASWLGKFARQKTVLCFHRRSSGRARMYVLFVPRGNRDMAAVAAELDSDGLANRTLVPRKIQMLIYVVDLKNELQAKVQTAARRLHARMSSVRGDGGFIGDENDRDKAQTIFEQELRRYEEGHPSARRACRKRAPLARVTAQSVQSRR